MFFTDSPEVQPEHLRWVIDHTASGELEWGMDPHGWSAVGTNVARRMGDSVVYEQNISDVRIGFEQPRYPWIWGFNYLTIFDASQGVHLEEGARVQPEVLYLAERTLLVASLAVRTEDGTLNGETRDCTSCQESTPHLDLCSAPYGMRGALMAGSERCECLYCGASTEATTV